MTEILAADSLFGFFNWATDSGQSLIVKVFLLCAGIAVIAALVSKHTITGFIVLAVKLFIGAFLIVGGIMWLANAFKNDVETHGNDGSLPAVSVVHEPSAVA